MNHESQTFDTAIAAAAQIEYIEQTGNPRFAPIKGVCWKCNRNIYEQIKQEHGATIYYTGISIQKAGSELVTGCPHCHWSYCE